MHIPRVVLAFLFCFALSNISHAQYTETINSNRPGQSQGAYAVGNKVIQLEVGYDFGSDEHSLLNTKTDIWGIDFAARYGGEEFVCLLPDYQCQFDALNI